MGSTHTNSGKPAQRRFWLNMEQYQTPETFREKTEAEFITTPKLAEELGVNRRNFMKLMGASAMMASLAGCSRRPVQKIVPYVNKPEEVTPGEPNYYSSADPATGYGQIVTTREGRPIKVDGLPGHPLNGNALSARGQASILDLYDPDRLRAPMVDGKSVAWDFFDEQLENAFKDRSDVYFLTSTVHSEGLTRAIKALGARHYQFDALPFDDIREGQRESYGRSVLPTYRFDRAKVIVSIDADFLDTWLGAEENARRFAKTRNPDDTNFSQLIAFESSMRLTGQNADKRVPIHPADQLHIALALAHEVARKTNSLRTPLPCVPALIKKPSRRLRMSSCATVAAAW